MSHRLSLALLAFLVVVSGFGMTAVSGAEWAAAADQQTVDGTANTTNYLSPTAGDRTQETYATTTVDVGSAVAVDAQRLHGDHERLVFDRRVDATTDPDDRLVLARNRADRIDDRITTIDRRQRELLRAYSNGTISEDELLRDLTRLGAIVERERTHIDHVRSNVVADSDVTLPASLQIRLTSLEADTVLLPTPVVDDLRGSVTGDRVRTTVYLQGSSDGLVLATVEDGRFVRQGTIRTARDPDQFDEFATGDLSRIESANQRAAELYPWIFENTIGLPTITGFGDTSVYRITASHPQGSFSTYIDGSTTDVFHDVHDQDASLVPVTATATNTRQGLKLTVESTTATGPLRVSLVDTTTGEPQEAEVVINGDTVGSTGDDGTLWTVQPVEQFGVNVQTPDNQTVAVSGP